MLDRPLFISDAAHSFGASYKGKKIGGDGLADISVFSFHAVKNITTAEGGAMTFTNPAGWDNNSVYREIMLYSLHGQNKDALMKARSGSWSYEIEMPGYKFNMTDIQAAMGLSQLRRYKETLDKRKILHGLYLRELDGDERIILPEFESRDKTPSYHLFPVRIKNADESKRNRTIVFLAGKGIQANVHFIPIPMHPAYRKLNYKITDFPNAYDSFKNEISLPLYPALTEEDIVRVCRELKKSLNVF